MVSQTGLAEAGILQGPAPVSSQMQLPVRTQVLWPIKQPTEFPARYFEQAGTTECGWTLRMEAKEIELLNAVVYDPIDKR